MRVSNRRVFAANLVKRVMLDTLLNFISEQKLFQRNQKILLAVSGGVDSMVMEHLFRKAGFNYAIAHCNFNLRGKSSDEDQLMVQKTAAKNKTQLFINSFTTEDYASQNMDGRSTQFERI